MARTPLTGGTLNATWADDEVLTGRFVAVKLVKTPGNKHASLLMTFKCEGGATCQKWGSKAWSDLFDAKAIQRGDVLEARAGTMKPGKGGRKFRPFDVVKLTGDDIPKGLRGK